MPCSLFTSCLWKQLRNDRRLMVDVLNDDDSLTLNALTNPTNSAKNQPQLPGLPTWSKHQSRRPSRCLSPRTSGASSKISTVVIHSEQKPLIQSRPSEFHRLGKSRVPIPKRCHRRFCRPHAHLISTLTHLLRSPRAFRTLLPMCNTLPLLPSPAYRRRVRPSRRPSGEGCARVGMELSSVSRVPRRSALRCNYSRVRYFRLPYCLSLIILPCRACFSISIYFGTTARVIITGETL